MPGIDLSGLWQGQFSYARGPAPEFFTATLMEAPHFLSGSILDATTPRRYASVMGRRNGFSVSFTKTYRGPDRRHSVQYDGLLSADQMEIDGEWRIPGNWSGQFLMIRESGLVLAVARKQAERV